MPQLGGDKADLVLFENGDSLYGRLETFTFEQGAVWRHPDSPEPITFTPDNILEVRFPEISRSVVIENPCVVEFLNGDSLEGTLAGCDAEVITLDTWYAGRLTIPRKQVNLLRPVSSARAPVFQGPAGLEGWVIGKVAGTIPDPGEWKYKNGAFFASRAASIARDVKLPDMASIRFDLAWKGSFHIALALYTDYLYPISLVSKETGPDFGGFYSLQMNSFSVRLVPVTKNDPLRELGQTAVPAFNLKNSADVELRVSKLKRQIALLVDGKLVKEWIDTESFIGQGTGIRLVHQGQGSVRFSNLRISEWDGQFEEVPTRLADRKQDLVRLRNGDRVQGVLESIAGGKGVVQLAGNKVEIPVERIKQVELVTPEPPERGSQRNQVRAFFPRGGGLTFELEKWDDKGVVAMSPNFGRAVFKPEAFTLAQFRVSVAPPVTGISAPGSFVATAP
jgi:hypothetical protein